MTRVEYRKLSMYRKLLLLQEAIDALSISDKEHKTVSGMISECIYTTAEYMNGTTDRRRVRDVPKAREKIRQETVIVKTEHKTKKERRQEAIAKANEVLSHYAW